jgi:hypothetical protein
MKERAKSQRKGKKAVIAACQPVPAYRQAGGRQVRNPSERFQTSWNDDHKERDLRNTTLDLYLNRQIDMLVEKVFLLELFTFSPII